MSINRVPSGVPTGGQFAEGRRAESAAGTLTAEELQSTAERQAQRYGIDLADHPRLAENMHRLFDSLDESAPERPKEFTETLVADHLMFEGSDEDQDDEGDDRLSEVTIDELPDGGARIFIDPEAIDDEEDRGLFVAISHPDLEEDGDEAYRYVDVPPGPKADALIANQRAWMRHYSYDLTRRENRDLNNGEVTPWALARPLNHPYSAEGRLEREAQFTMLINAPDEESFNRAADAQWAYGWDGDSADLPPRPDWYCPNGMIWRGGQVDRRRWEELPDRGTW